MLTHGASVTSIGSAAPRLCTPSVAGRTVRRPLHHAPSAEAWGARWGPESSNRSNSSEQIQEEPAVASSTTAGTGAGRALAPSGLSLVPNSLRLAPSGQGLAPSVPSGLAPAGPASSSSPPGPRSLWDKVVAWFVGDGDVKSKLASLGFAAMLSYSVVSNVTYGAALTFSWIGFVKAKGVSPIAEGQWPAFLAFYAGAWMVQNFARPMRFGMAMAMTPWYDNLLANMAATLRVSKRFAFGIALSVMAFGMPVFLGSAIYLLGGLPDGLGPLPPLKRF